MKVRSTNVKEVKIFLVNGILEVEVSFNYGTTYLYKGVPLQEVLSFINAPSIGKAISKLHKYQYDNIKPINQKEG